jgi:hypothetical protein
VRAVHMQHPRCAATVGDDVFTVRVVAPAFLDGHVAAVAHDQVALIADAADVGRLHRPRAQLTKRLRCHHPSARRIGARR